MSDLQTIASQICSLLRNRYSEPEVVLGSQLGGLILRNFPSVNLKTTFGGLRAFIAEYLKDFVSEVGTKGSDVQYKIEFSQRPKLSNSNGAVEEIQSIEPIQKQSIPAKSPAASLTVNLWHALVNPKSRVSCFWNARDQELVFPNAGGRPPTGSCEFASVSYQEHVDITRKFLIQRGLDISILEADPADLHGYVPAVVQILRSRGVQSDWEKFRVDEILKLIRNRLLSLGAIEETISRTLVNLRASKINVRSGYQSHTVAAPTIYRDPQNSEIKLREFLARAVTQMPIEELRELKISGATLEKTLSLL